MSRYAYEDDPNETSSPRGPRLALAGVALLIGVGVLVWRLTAPVGTDPEGNLADRFQHLAPFTTLYATEAGWIGELPMDWSGVLDRAQAKKLCASMALEFKPTGKQTVQLMSVDGNALAECTAP